MNFPSTTIVIPVLRQVDDWLEQGVNSALNQTAPCRVLAITSPMTTASNLRILERMQRETTLEVFEQIRPGFAAALNTGIAKSTTARVGFLLSDDWLEPDAVEECLRYSTDIVSTAQRTYAEDGIREIPTLRQRLTMKAFERQPTLEQKAKYLQHFFLFRKDKLEEVGGVDENLGDWPGVDDYDLIWVLLEHGASVSVVNKLLYNYRDHCGERLTLRRPEEAIANLGRVFAKHRVPIEERRKLIAAYRIWFGKPLHAVKQNASPSNVSPHYSVDRVRDGREVWRLRLRSAGETDLPCHAEILCEGNAGFVKPLDTASNLLNGVLNFALDSGLLTMYWPATHTPIQKCLASKTNIGGFEYWRIDIHENVIFENRFV